MSLAKNKGLHMQNISSPIHLKGSRTSLVIDTSQRMPSICYYGKLLSDQSSFAMLKLLSTRQEGKCAVVEEAPLSLSPGYGGGFTGHPGLEMFNEHNAWSFNGDIEKVEQHNNNEVTITCVDALRKVAVKYYIKVDILSDVLAMQTQLINDNDHLLHVNWCAAPTMPISNELDTIMSFEGRWANEFHRQSIPRYLGSHVRENRRGKTSHDNFPGVVIHQDKTDEHQGSCIGFHFGWSGNHKLVSELMADGRGFVQMGELLAPGEIRLSRNESYKSPVLYVCYAEQGFNQMSQSFHQYIRQNIMADSVTSTIRPIHYNTWEGIYFDHDVETLSELAQQAADIGAERFVLDDGWFKGRRGDKAGLGDWFVDNVIYPQGLQPLIDKVLATGMAFGIWFEPEMVNPDSDLFRKHPDWVLSSEGNEQLNFRNQLVLDLTRDDVCGYLFECIDSLLVQYPDISYIKWDMNRDVNHAGNFNGQPAIHAQTLSLYKLIEKIKHKHTGVEIESCCSGGGRIDLGILKHTDRVWTSDSNDALDRLEIQRGCSYFFPSQVMGAHVGPLDCHITGRRVSMEMRAAVAMFGHMGIEMDPRSLTAQERSTLKEALSVHKANRELIHTGNLVRLNNNDYSIDFGVISQDKSSALFAYNCVSESLRVLPNKYLFKGLNADALYKLELVWPISVDKVKQYSASILNVIDGELFTGELLMQQGMQLPLLDPQSSLVFKLTIVSD
jgi:alpha-galactosidase